MKAILDYLVKLDRRWVFLLMALAIVTPLIWPREMPEKPTPIVRDAFNQIENLPSGSRILMSFDYDPGSAPELQPMATALTWHAAKKGHKIYFMALWPLGVNMIQDTVDLVLHGDFPDIEYGRDYVNLGFKPGAEGVIRLMMTNMRDLFPTDQVGRSLRDLELTRDLVKIGEMKLLISISAGSGGSKEWIQYAATPYNIPIIIGTTGVSVPGHYPYYPRQMQGMLGAIKGASEYEYLLAERYPEYAVSPVDGTRRIEFTRGLERMGPQLVAHIFIMFLIVLGNAILFLQRAMRRAA